MPPAFRRGLNLLNVTINQFVAFYFKSDQGTGRQMDNMKGKRKFEATDIGNVGLVTSSEENGEQGPVPLTVFPSKFGVV